MADETKTYLQNVYLGDTTADVVEKINNAIGQVNENMDLIEDAGKVDEIQVHGTNVVNSNKVVNIKGSTNVTVSGDPSTGEITILSTYVNTKDTAGTGPLDTKLWLIGTPPVDGKHPAQNSTEKTYTGGAYAMGGELYTYDDKQVLDTDDYAALAKLIGDLAGGMEYIGTSNLIATSGTGTESAPYIITDKTYGVGNTYKVTTKGYYKYKNALLSKPLPDGTTTNLIGVGDLFIYAADNTWSVVPSGDDGDVYADEAWSSPDKIIVTGDETTANKGVKSSGKSISTSITGSTAAIPTDSAVKRYVDDLIIKVPITGEKEDAWTDYIETQSLLVLTGYSNYTPIAVYTSGGELAVVGLGKTGDGAIGIGVSSEKAADIINGTLVLMRV